MKNEFTGRIGTVELFAGIGGFRIASDRLGFKTVWANDINPKSCEVYRNRFGRHELREGDIRELANEIPEHNLLTAGFPCQPFSSAGKKEGIRDARGTLFQVIVKILQEHRPDFFVLENVKRLLSMERGSHFATILHALARLDYHIEWRLLNAMNFGLSQNRQRVFIIGIKQPEKCTNDDARVKSQKSGLWPAIPIQYRGLVCQISTFDATVNDGPTIHLSAKEDLLDMSPAQYDCLVDFGMWREIKRHAARFSNWGMARKGRFFDLNIHDFTDGKNPPKLKSVLQSDVPDMFDFTCETLERLRDSTLVEKFVSGVEILSNQNGGARMGYTVFGTEGIAPTLTAATSRHYERYKIGDRYRRLTNIEYARLQGFPDNHCQAVSVYDQYMLYGNAVPPPMVEWVIEKIIKEAGVVMPEPCTLFNCR